MKNVIPTLFLYKPGWDRERKREKKFSPEFRSYSTRVRKFQKNRKKIKKWLSSIIFSQNGMRLVEKERKKIYSQIPFILDPRKKISKKIAKKFKKFKNFFPALFSAKTAWDRPRKREKNFSPEFRSYSTKARNFQKIIENKLKK